MNEVVAQRWLRAQTIQIVRGDLTQEATDAIVNAANWELRHGAGVAGAIVRRGGDAVQEESDAWVRKHGPVLHEAPAWTSGGSLPAKYVIHAVGPIWGEGDEDSKLEAAILGSLKLADQLGTQSISIPGISTGIFGFPKERAAEVVLRAIRSHFERNESGLSIVRLVLFDEPTVKAFLSAWSSWDQV